MSIATLYPWQQEAWQSFIENVDRSFTHALMVTGMPGTGIDKFADAQCRYLLNLQDHNSHMAELSHPDLMWVRRRRDSPTKPLKSAILVDQIRKLTHYLYQKPAGKRKVAVIELAEECNLQAANALLKPLEEPVPDSHIILLSYSPGQLLSTIRSRCVQLNISAPDRQVAVTWLGQANDDAKEYALWLTAGMPVTAAAMLAEQKIAELMELDSELANMLEQKTLDCSLIKRFAAATPALINTFLLRTLLTAAGMEHQPQVATAAVLQQLPLVLQQQLVRDCFSRRQIIVESATTDHELMLANQLVFWLEMLRQA